jgi:hypothetical protein
VSFPELFFGILLVLLLVGLAGYFTWRQLQTRRALANDRRVGVPPLGGQSPANAGTPILLSSEERGFLIRQMRRRLTCSVLMFLFAAMLIGWYFIESNLPDLKVAAEEAPGKTHPLVELLALYWILALCVLFAIVALAGMDFFATARYAMHQRKLLEAERRAALEIEVARLRKQRDGS